MLGKEQYQKDAKTLRTAMAGWGSDEEPIIAITAFRTNADRQEILKEYKTMYGRDALQDLEDELGGDLGKCIQAMYLTPVVYDCKELYKAMKGTGTDEDTLIEIIGSRSNSQLKQIKDKYLELYKVTLEEDVISETSGTLKRILVSTLQCNRGENSQIDATSLNQELKELYEAGEGQWGTDESAFNKIFSIRSPSELKYLNSKYSEVVGKSLFSVIDSEFSGDEAAIFKAILLSHINPPEYFAERIRKACKGLGTNDQLLIRVLVTRDEVDLKEIDKVYKQKYQMTLKEQIEEECSGDYKKLLVSMVKS